MDKKYIEENEIEIKYLRNQLSDKELEEFEVYLLENPEVFDSLSIEAVLVEQTSAVSSNTKKLKKTWAFIPATLAVGLSVLLVSLSIGFTFHSFQQGDKELELYAVRGDNEFIPTLERTIGQKYWPLKSDITLKAQVSNSQSFSSAQIEKLEPDSVNYKEVKFYSDIKVLDTGDIEIDIDLGQLVNGRYRLVLKQNDEVGTDKAQRDWVFQFKVI